MFRKSQKWARTADLCSLNVWEVSCAVGLDAIQLSALYHTLNTSQLFYFLFKLERKKSEYLYFSILLREQLVSALPVLVARGCRHIGTRIHIGGRRWPFARTWRVWGVTEPTSEFCHSPSPQRRPGLRGSSPCAKEVWAVPLQSRNSYHVDFSKGMHHTVV